MTYKEFVTRHQSRMLEELTEWLSIPSISTLPDHAADCRRAADWLVAEFGRLGFSKVKLLEGTAGHHPIVWAEGPKAPGRPTLLIYGHYDVQPVDPIDLWATRPFEPTVRDGNLYARGAADDKGQVYCLLKAFEASMAAAGGTPPVNVRFMIEGEEETGSHHISELVAREPERLHADAVLVCDLPYYAPRWPAVYTALRGICYAEITVRTLTGDLHSGIYGGVAPNAHETLVRMLSRLKSDDGRIRIPGLYDDVNRPTRKELAMWKALPLNERRYMRSEVGARALTGLTRKTVHERLWALPTFEIHGISGGFTGEGAKTVIPAEAKAKVSLRLVPDQKERRVRQQLKRAVKAVTPPWATADVQFIHGGDPVQVDIDAPVFEHLGTAFREVVGRAAVPIRVGGSIPIVSALAGGKAPVVLTGIGLPDDQLHAPNEKITLNQLWDGVQVFARLFDLVGAGG